MSTRATCQYILERPRVWVQFTIYRLRCLVQSADIHQQPCHKILNNSDPSHQNTVRWRGEPEVLTCRSRSGSRLGHPSFSHSSFSIFSSIPSQSGRNNGQTSSIEEKTHRPFCITAFTKPLGNSPSACSSKSDFFIVNTNPPFSWYTSVMPGKLWILESSRERLYMSPTFSL